MLSFLDVPNKKGLPTSTQNDTSPLRDSTWFYLFAFAIKIDMKKINFDFTVLFAESTKKLDTRLFFG